MKKVLIITDLFHSSPRIPGLCKYLKDFGWDPTLLVTPLGKNPEARFGPSKEFLQKFRIIEVSFFDLVGFLKTLAGFKKQESSRVQLEKKLGGRSLVKPLIKKLLILAGAIFAYPDEVRNWKGPAIKKGLELLKNEKFDALLTSSSPVTSHLIARELKKVTALPWHADLRDLWTQNHNYPFPQVRKILETRLEIKTLSDADSLSSVSEGTVQKLKGRYKSKSVFTIHNGFDPEFINNPPAPLSQKFTIIYTGTIYYQKQDPEKFLRAVKELIDEGKIDKGKLEINFYGGTQAWFNELISKLGMENLIIQRGVIPRGESFKKQRASQVLLLFGWEDEYELGVFPIKLFEYFAARRPILATGGTPKEEFRKILDETKAGRHAIAVPEIKKILLEYYKEYLKRGVVSYHGIDKEMDNWSYRGMAKKFVSAIERAIKINSGKR